MLNYLANTKLQAGMNRREFIASLAAAFALDPERLLWIPGAKKIFIPSAEIKVFSVEEMETWTEVDAVGRMFEVAWAGRQYEET